MKVRTKDMLIHRSLESILAIIAPTNDYFPKWLCIPTKICATAVIFITHQHIFSRFLKITLERHMGHKARITTFGIKIEQTYSFKFRPLKRLIIMPKKLVPGTDTQENCI